MTLFDSSPSPSITTTSTSTTNKTDREAVREELEDLANPILNVDFVHKVLEDWSRPLPKSYTYRPLVIVGPSGVGKGRLTRALLADYKRFFEKVITHTTRPPRPGEIADSHYHFVSYSTFQTLQQQRQEKKKKTMKTMKTMMNSSSGSSGSTDDDTAVEQQQQQQEEEEGEGEGYFLESAIVHDHSYGISRSAWQLVEEKGKIPLLEIDIQGAKTLKSLEQELQIDPIYFFIAPPSIEQLRERLQIRGSESNEEIELRLKNAKEEIIQAKHSVSLFHEYLINDQMNVTINTFFRLVRDQ